MDLTTNFMLDRGTKQNRSATKQNRRIQGRTIKLEVSHSRLPPNTIRDVIMKELNLNILLRRSCQHSLLRLLTLFHIRGYEGKYMAMAVEEGNQKIQGNIHRRKTSKTKVLHDPFRNTTRITRD